MLSLDHVFNLFVVCVLFVFYLFDVALSTNCFWMLKGVLGFSKSSWMLPNCVKAFCKHGVHVCLNFIFIYSQTVDFQQVEGLN